MKSKTIGEYQAEISRLESAMRVIEQFSMVEGSYYSLTGAISKRIEHLEQLIEEIYQIKFNKLKK